MTDTDRPTTAPRTLDRETRLAAIKAAQATVFDWYAKGLSRFGTDDDGSDDLILGERVADAVLTQVESALRAAPQPDDDGLRRALDRLTADVKRYASSRALADLLPALRDADAALQQPRTLPARTLDPDMLARAFNDESRRAESNPPFRWENVAAAYEAERLRAEGGSGE